VQSDSSGQYLSVNAKQPERPALQAELSRCESGHGCQTKAEVLQKAEGRRS
jgi:hypothetical protein